LLTQPTLHTATLPLRAHQTGAKNYVGAVAYAPPGFLPGLPNGAIISGVRVQTANTQAPAVAGVHDATAGSC
jgi:hypothetical protein